MTSTTAAPPNRRAAIRSLQSGTIGAIVEWYEYTIYGTTAALVFGTLFFPELQSGIAQIAALATFGVGFLARRPGMAPSSPDTWATGSAANLPWS